MFQRERKGDLTMYFLVVGFHDCTCVTAHYDIYAEALLALNNYRKDPDFCIGEITEVNTGRVVMVAKNV